MNTEERRLLANRLCQEARRGDPCVQRKLTAKMVTVDGVLRHKVCAELLKQLEE